MKKKFMSGTMIFLIWIILIEIIGVILFSFLTNSCGSACDTHSFLNPFGINNDKNKACIAMCVEKPYPIFFWISDLLILTIVIYIIYIAKNYKIKNKK